MSKKPLPKKSLATQCGRSFSSTRNEPMNLSVPKFGAEIRRGRSCPTSNRLSVLFLLARRRPSVPRKHLFSNKFVRIDSQNKMKQLLFSILRKFDFRLQRISAEKNYEREIVRNKYVWLGKHNIQKIVDIGANDGHFAAESSTAFTDKKYFCFEPIPSVFEALKKRFKERSNFSFFNYALGESNSTGIINLNEYSPSSSLLEMEDRHTQEFDYARNTTQQEIAIRRLDDFIEQIDPHLDTLVKIDVQGYELCVISGGLEFIKRSKVVVIETSFETLYKEQPVFHDIYTRMVELGFVYHGNVEQLLSPSSHEILQADSVFINQRS